MSNRRKFLRATLGFAVGVVLFPLRVLAGRPEGAFGEESMDAVMKSMFQSAPMESGDIKVKAPEIAENGAVVPISVRYNIPGAESVSIIVENNPNPLVASFALTASSGGLVSTRIKMGKTSTVHAIVKAGGKLYRASTDVKVTIGGCGG